MCIMEHSTTDLFEDWHAFWTRLMAEGVVCVGIGECRYRLCMDDLIGCDDRAYWRLVMLSRIIQGYASMDSDGKAVR